MHNLSFGHGEGDRRSQGGPHIAETDPGGPLIVARGTKYFVTGHYSIGIEVARYWYLLVMATGAISTCIFFRLSTRIRKKDSSHRLFVCTCTLGMCHGACAPGVL